MRYLISTIVALSLLTGTGAAAMIQTWEVGDIGPGSNIENILSVAGDPAWMNTHIEISLTSGSIIHFGTNTAYHFDAMGVQVEDTGCYPANAAVAYHFESETYVETDWAVPNPGLSSLSPAYVVTLTPDAMGTFLVRTWELFHGTKPTYDMTGDIVNGVIPEPTTLGLLAVGAVALIRRRR